MKFNALKKYVEIHNEKNPENQIEFAFARDKEVEDELGDIHHELYFSNTEWTESLDNEHWKPIKNIFN